MSPFKPNPETQEQLGIIEEKNYGEIVAGIEEEVDIHKRLAERAERLIQAAKSEESVNISGTVWVRNPDYSIPGSDFFYGVRYDESEQYFLLVTKLTAPDMQKPDSTVEIEETVALIGAPIVFSRTGTNDIDNKKDKNPINYDAYGVADPSEYKNPLSWALDSSSEVFKNTDDTITFMEMAIKEPGSHYEEPLSV